ncbi:hypothetical protein R9X47_20710 [Wukongibacter baidiensis]|uniref:hypothetical protein n=1 Tax=Wukongibacter baidiensis TaxID=1723361 RepID=UPI003D7F512C
MVPNRKNNEFEKEIDRIKEWQDNQYNPGYYMGTGHTQRPLSQLSKYPVLLIVIGILNFIMPILFLVTGREVSGSFIVQAILGGIFIYGGVQRLKNRKK